MELFILLAILILNVLAAIITYHFLGGLPKKQKYIFIGIGFAISYIIVTIIYWIGDVGIDNAQIAETAKTFITFSFVPVNVILALPFLAKSLVNLKTNKLKKEKFRNRCILIAVILVIVLIMEFSYFKDIQQGILNMLNS